MGAAEDFLFQISRSSAITAVHSSTTANVTGLMKQMMMTGDLPFGIPSIAGTAWKVIARVLGGWDLEKFPELKDLIKNSSAFFTEFQTAGYNKFFETLTLSSEFFEAFKVIGFDRFFNTLDRGTTALEKLAEVDIIDLLKGIGSVGEFFKGALEMQGSIWEVNLETAGMMETMAPGFIGGIEAFTANAVPSFVWNVGWLFAVTLPAWFARAKAFIDTFAEASRRKIIKEALPTLLDFQTAIRSQWFDISSRDEIENEVGWQGLSMPRYDALVTVSRPQLHTDELHTLIAREQIDYVEYEQRYARLGYDLATRTHLEKLFWQVPPVPDLIRMAVREVFYPEYRVQFRLDEEFPVEFQQWANKQGLNEYWSRAFWAAHWELPSIQMGFEMLHKRIIKREELESLLKALDVMPWWRDRLVDLSYRPLTRVDVRRMHNVEVLDVQGVFDAYLDLGYSPENAGRMTDFTLRFNARDDKLLSKSETLRGYKEGLLSGDDTWTLLRELGYADVAIDYYLYRADFENAEADRKQMIKLIADQYEKGIIDKNAAIAAFAAQDLDWREIQVLVHRSDVFLGFKRTGLSLAQVTRFYRKRIISVEQCVEELRKLYYPDKYIQWIIRDSMF